MYAPVVGEEEMGSAQRFGNGRNMGKRAQSSAHTVRKLGGDGWILFRDTGIHINQLKGLKVVASGKGKRGRGEGGLGLHLYIHPRTTS